MTQKTNMMVFSGIVALVAVLALTTGMIRPDGIYRVKDGKIISFSRMIADARTAKVVFVGEIHDDPDTHRMELEIIRALHESDTPLAIGLEMFRAANQHSLDAWTTGVLSTEKFIPVYYENWNEAWPLYRSIFLYARNHRIPMVGLNIPDRVARAVAERGFGSLTSEEKKELPPDISCSVDPTYMEFIRRAYAGHARRVDRQFVNFCEAQMVWDKSMAWHLASYLKRHPRRTVVVLAGVGHAWKRGIPEQLTLDSPYPYRVIMPLVPDQIEQNSVTEKDTDYVFLR